MVRWIFALYFLFPTLLLAQQPPAPAPAPGQPATAKGTAPGAAQLQAPKRDAQDELQEISKIREFLQPFYYDREKFRDPFETQGSAAPLQPGQVYGPFLHLQTYRLKDFELKALLWQTSRPVAVFFAPDKKEYRLTIKDYIGENFGYVAAIREREVVIIQTIEEDNKRYSTTKVVFLNE